MKIIDAHIHFWHYNVQRDTWITDDMQVIRRNFLPADAIREFEACGVEGCVAVQADQTEAETRFLLDLADQHAEIKAVVGWIDLKDETAEILLNRYQKERKLKGFRHIIQGQPDEAYFIHKGFQQGMRLLAPLGYTYDVLVYHDQLPQAIRFTEKYPDQRFMLDHLAKPAIRHGQWKAWREDIRELAKNPNVYCKVSGMITEADWKQWRYEDLLPYMEIVAEYFGTDRLCYGSDWPVALVAGTYPEVLQVVRTFLLQVPEAAREKVLSGNTRTFYKLD
jgi:L-fuconolactonase